MKEKNVKRKAKKILTEYLLAQKKRKTITRFTILDEIYSQNTHFDIDKLYYQIRKKNYQISKATVYNTIDVLLDAKLIVKHQLSSFRHTIYERAINELQHDHLICTTCGKIIEFCETQRLDNIKSDLMKKHEFMPHHHTLYIYGVCKKCHQVTY